MFVADVCDRAIVYVEEDEFWFHENVTNGDVSHVVEDSIGLVEQSKHNYWVELNFKKKSSCSKLESLLSPVKLSL